MKNKNSVLEKLGIDENQSLEEVIAQLKNKLENKVNEDKMSQIIEATTTYFNEKSAVVEDSVVQPVIEEQPVQNKETVAQVEDTVVQPVVEELQNEQPVQSKETVAQVEDSIVKPVVEELKSEQPDQTKETVAQAKPPFNLFEFYNEKDKNGFWQKVYAACTAALVIVSMLLSKRFALSINIQSSSVSPLMRGVAESKFLLFVLLLLIIAIAGIYYVETKLYKNRSSYFSRILSVIASGFGALGFILSLKPVYLATKFLTDMSGNADLEPVSKALEFTKTIQFQVVYTFALWIGIAACVAIYFSLQKNKEFVLAKTKQQPLVNVVVEEAPAL